MSSPISRPSCDYPIFDRLRFHQIDMTRWIVANSPGRIRSTIVNHDTLAAALSESDAEIYHAHRSLPGVHQVGLIGPGGINLVSFIHSRFAAYPAHSSFVPEIGAHSPKT